MILLPGPDREPIAVDPAHVTAVQPYHAGSIVWVDGRVLLRVNLDVEAVVEAIGHNGGESLQSAFREGYIQGMDATLSGHADEQRCASAYGIWRAELAGQ